MTDATGLRVALTSRATLLDRADRASALAPGMVIEQVAAHGTIHDRRASLAGAFAVVAGAEPYSAELLDRLPDLCLIARSGVGFDAIDIAAASRLGIHVTTTPGSNAQGVAEHAVTLLLHLTHRVPHYDARVRSGQWRDGEFYTEVQGMTVGLVGFGRIGRATGALLHALGARVLAFDPGPVIEAPPYVTMVGSLDELLPQCRAVSLHTPLLGSTRGLIGAAQLALLPNGAFLVNTARGGIVDESALESALRSGHLAGAALDVLETEPPSPDHPLLALDTCVFSPHSASLGSHTVERMTLTVESQLNAVAQGLTPPDLVNDPAGARFPALVRG